MKKSHIFLLLFALFTLIACNKNEDNPTPDPALYTLGKNRFTLNIDGVEREFYVHVPGNYTGKSAYPVVFMLHGTSGDGEKFYEGSGWKEVGEKEGILTVYPSSGRYCIIDPVDGVKTTTKWNTPPDAEFTFCAGQTPLNDIKFLRAVIDDLNRRLKVDSKRIYLVGFSNGGQMAAKCAIEMSDLLAAVVESAGSFALESVTYTPKRKLPVTYQVGNDDWGPGNEGPDLPLSGLDSLLKRPDFKYYRISQAHIRHFNLDPKYTISGDTSSAVVAQYKSASGQPNNVFQFIMVKGIKHAYPDFAASANWNWLKQYTLP
jgi:polyhydroxybutyrate depolymerase